MKYFKNKKGGYSFTEVIISVAIIGLIFNIVGRFAGDVFSLNSIISGGLNTQLDAKHLIKVMVTELRKTMPSSLGSYPIELANSSAITFFSDVNSDGLKERIRYYMDGTNLKKGMIIPSGTPLSYVSSNEKKSTLMSGVISSSTQPLFQYYSSTYTGSSAPLSIPVNISEIRLIKITVIIDKDPLRSPVPLTVTSSVSLRNLKDNL